MLLNILFTMSRTSSFLPCPTVNYLAKTSTVSRMRDLDLYWYSLPPEYKIWFALKHYFISEIFLKVSKKKIENKCHKVEKLKQWGDLEWHWKIIWETEILPSQWSLGPRREWVYTVAWWRGQTQCSLQSSYDLELSASSVAWFSTNLCLILP